MRLSVIIPNYNYGALLAQTIQSVLNQTVLAHEIIVVDDGSTDNSRAVMEGFGHKIITIFQENKGQAAALSAGFEKATGDIICLLDSDDFFHPQKIEILQNTYSQNPTAEWVFHDMGLVNGSDIPQFSQFLTTDIHPKILNLQEDMVRGKVDFVAPATSGLSFRKDFIDKLFPLPVAESIYISDHYIKFYCLAMGQGAHITDFIGGQRVHGNNLYTGTKQTAMRGKIFVSTALALREKCPQISRFCNNLMAEGRACLSASGEKDTLRNVIETYQSTLSPLELLIIEFKQWIKSRRKRRNLSE